MGSEGSRRAGVRKLACLTWNVKAHVPTRRAWERGFAKFPLLDLNESAAKAIDAYIARMVMPAIPAGDALHLAAASFRRCDFLVTWNCLARGPAAYFSWPRLAERWKQKNEEIEWVFVLPFIFLLVSSIFEVCQSKIASAAAEGLR
jgi:hypothetical protein